MFILIPFVSFAYTYLEQDIWSDVSDNEYAGWNLDLWQYLGTGLEGIPESVKLYINKNTMVSSGNPTYITLAECPDISYTSCSNVLTSDGQAIQSGAYYYTYEFSSEYELDNTKYYAVRVYYLGTSGYSYVYGTSVDNYANGSTTAGSLDDIYFVFNTTDASYYGDTTRIISFLPEAGTTTPSGVPVDFEINVWVSPVDLGTVYGVDLRFQNYDLNHLWNDYGTVFLDNIDLTDAGYYTYSTSTSLPDGTYMVEARLRRTYFGLIPNPLSDISDYQTHLFAVGTSSFLGFLSTDARSLYEDWASSTTATSSPESYCTIWSSDSDIKGCIAWLMYPDITLIQQTVNDSLDEIGDRFPIGYVNDLYSILSTTSSSSIPVLEYTLPKAVNVGQPTLTLDFNNSIDWFLNSTSSMYGTDDSFYDVTAPYWQKLLYILAFLYILGRILGRRIV